MKNKIIDAFKVANRLVSITVENPDFLELRINQFVKIGGKDYRVHSIPFFDSNPSKSILERDTFTIDYTDDELVGKEVLFNE